MSNQFRHLVCEMALKTTTTKVSQFTDHKNNITHKLKIETCIELIELSARTPYRLLLSFLFHTIYAYVFCFCFFLLFSVSADRLGTRSKPVEKIKTNDFFRFCIKLLRAFDRLSFSTSSGVERAAHSK